MAGAVPACFCRVPAQCAAEVRAGQIDAVIDSRSVAERAEDLAAIADDAAVSGCQRVERTSAESAEPVTDEVASDLGVVDDDPHGGTRAADPTRVEQRLPWVLVPVDRRGEHGRAGRG